MRRRGATATAVVVAGAIVGVVAWLRAPAPPPPRRAEPRSPSSSLVGSASAAEEPGADEVTGTVRDPDGHGVARAQVCAHDARRDDDDVVPCVVTGGDGRYVLAGPRPATYCASAAGFAPTCRRADAAVVDLELIRGGAIVRGVVRDLTGGPVEGALVRADDDRAAVVVARSGADGRFQLAVAAARVAITAVAPSYAPASVEALAPEDGVELVLLTEAVLGGRVVKHRTGAALADADVVVRALDGGATRRVRTAADGSFLVAGLGPGRYAIEASAAGWAGVSDGSVALSLFQTSREIVVVVRPAARVEGRLVTPEGNGCTDGVVALGGRQATTDRTGRVAFESVPPGRYVVAVRCAGYAPRPSYPDVIVTERAETALTWELASATLALHGTVTDARGGPVAGVRVEARPSATGGDVGAEADARSDALGRFELNGLRAGRYDVLPVAASGQPLGAAVGRELAPAGEVAPVVLVARATGALRGRVLGADGAPAARRMVALVGAEPGLATQTTGGGVFTFDGLTPGRYRVGILARATPGGPPVDEAAPDAAVDVDVEAGRTADVTLRPSTAPGRIVGRVVGPRGEPIADAFVVAVADEPGGDSPVEGRPVLTGPDGTFTLAGLVARRYRVRAFQVEGDAGSLDGIRPGATVTIRLATRGVIAGRVTAAGHVVERFTLRVRGLDGGVWRAETFAGTGGGFRLEGLPADRYELAAVAAEGRATRTVALGPAEVRSGEQLVLSPLGSIRGRVSGTAGAPRSGIAVLLLRADEGAWASAGEPVETDADGTFTIEGLAVGPGVLLVADPASRTSAELEVAVRSGAPTDVGTIVLDASTSGDEAVR